MLLCVIRCVDVTLIIKYMLWNVYRMLAERHVVVSLWWLILRFFFFKKKKIGSSQMNKTTETKLQGSQGIEFNQWTNNDQVEAPECIDCEGFSIYS